MDVNQAILYAQLLNAAYAVSPQNTVNDAGKDINVSAASPGVSYQVATTLFGNDLATDFNPLRLQSQVSIGLILQSTVGDVVIAIRGTEGILEWAQDASFLNVKCPFLVGAGSTEDGFTEVYQSMRTGLDSGSPRVAQALATILFTLPVKSLTICGHSMGGALATLLALDIAANTAFKHPTVYTYASPKTGDPLFVSTYNQVVPNTIRIANRVDLVPKLPLPPLYEHVLGLVELNPIKLGLPPKSLIKFDIPCQHFLSSYLYLLSLQPGSAAAQTLDAKCAP